MQKNVESFLKEHGMWYGDIDVETEIGVFQKQMQAGLAGASSSLMMIPTYVQAASVVPHGKTAIVIDAGGTNIRVAAVRFDDQGQPVISGFKKHPMPGTRGALTADEFYHAIAAIIDPLLSESATVGFCFSFPTEILPNREGRVLSFNKNVQVTGAEGTLIGESINRVLTAAGKPTKKFILLNDTVATMLGGIAAGGGGQYSGFAGLIVGTGTNSCYLESCAAIVKSPEAASCGGKMAVNMESGGYDGFAQGSFDQALDQVSTNPGVHKMEKMVSGAYLGELICRIAQGAAAAGLFSAQFVTKLGSTQSFLMQDVDAFCADVNGTGALAQLTTGNTSDQQTLFDIVDACYERAARMVAVNLGAIMMQTKNSDRSGNPVCVAAEGTVFEKSDLLRAKIEQNLRDIERSKGLSCKLIKVDDANLIGTAVSALMNE